MFETKKELKLIVPPNWLERQAKGQEVHKSFLYDISSALDSYLTIPEDTLAVSKHNTKNYERKVVQELADRVEDILNHPAAYMNELHSHGFITERSLLSFQNGLPGLIAGKLVANTNPIKYIDVTAQSAQTADIFGKHYTAQRIPANSDLGQIILKDTEYDKDKDKYISHHPAIKEIYDVF